MAKNITKHDPLEAAKITSDRAAADVAALGATMPVDPARPSAALIAATAQPVSAAGVVPPGQFVPPEIPDPPAPPLREDGPTIEEWIAAGYDAANYPPALYAEKPSPGLTRHKAGGTIDPEWIEAAREAPPVAKKIVYVVLADGRGNCGGAQVNFFRKGDVLELAGYGQRGIQRLIDSGLKLERQER